MQGQDDGGLKRIKTLIGLTLMMKSLIQTPKRRGMEEVTRSARSKGNNHGERRGPQRGDWRSSGEFF